MTSAAEPHPPAATPPTPPPDGGRPGDHTEGGDEQVGYAAALSELDDILHELDGDEVDVDVLGARVRRAAELLRICRGRIASARFEVEQVVAELESDTAPGGEE